MKKVLYALIAIIGFANATIAQVPSYVPTNGLVGFWPFNGNANDVSGNGKNGTVNGATLTSDRFENNNKSFSFGGNLQSTIGIDLGLPYGDFTISFWLNALDTTMNSIMDWRNTSNQLPVLNFSFNGSGFTALLRDNINSATVDVIPNFSPTTNSWYFITLTKNSNQLTFYIDGLIKTTKNYTQSSWTLNRLTLGNNYYDSTFFYTGKIDDIGIWNRALTAQEITNLYRVCGDNIITNQPTNANVGLGLNAQFTTTSATGSTYQWQTNPLNIGWMNVPANSYYNGVNTNTLRVNNVSVSNHNQPFRALVNSNGCSDTSNVANLQVADTCLTTVTDTLIIKTTVGLPTPNTTNTLLIYPNPAKDRITIDNGNYTVMAGYSIKIENSLGQQVFSSAITQAQFNIDLSTWTGKGIYFVRVLDTQGNVVTTRKILLQ
jgi:hypothetical protein